MKLLTTRVQVIQGTMKKAVENFIAGIFLGLIRIFIDILVASLFILFTSILAVSSLICLTLGWTTAAMLFGIGLLSVTLGLRSHCWSKPRESLMDPETMDLIVAAEVTYLVFIKQGFTVFNCFVIISSFAMAYLLPYR